MRHLQVPNETGAASSSAKVFQHALLKPLKVEAERLEFAENIGPLNRAVDVKVVAVEKCSHCLAGQRAKSQWAAARLTSRYETADMRRQLDSFISAAAYIEMPKPVHVHLEKPGE